MGDAWIYGVPSDPLKNAQFRELSRARDECVKSGGCDLSSAAMHAFDRLLVKIPEHTWGLAQSFFTADYQNYTNVQFQAALKDSLAAGPLANQSDTRGAASYGSQWRGDYYTTIQSWYEQRSYVHNAIGVIANFEASAEAERQSGRDGSGSIVAAHAVAESLIDGHAHTLSAATPPASANVGVPTGWASELAERVAALSVVELPTAASLIANGYTQVALDQHANGGTGIQRCGESGSSTVEFALDSSAAIVWLRRHGGIEASSPSWANATRPIGQFLYQTFDDADYATFLGPPPAGFGLGCAKSLSPLCGNFNRFVAHSCIA